MARRPKRISRKLLTGDEEVLLESRASAIKYMTGGLIALLFFVFFILFAFWTQIEWLPEMPLIQPYLEGEYGWIISWASIAIAVIFVLVFVSRWLRWISTSYVMTDCRVITKKGLIGREFDDMPLHMVTNVEVSQSGLQRVFGYGTIVFSSQSGERDDVIWSAVPRPLRVRRTAQEAMEAERKRR